MSLTDGHRDDKRMTMRMVPVPLQWRDCPWRDDLPGQLPADWSPVVSSGYTAYARADGLHVVVSASMEKDGKRWLHVSLSYADRLPTWAEYVTVKELFIGAARYAVQVIPPRAEYISDHDFCLHLFSCLDGHVLPDFRRTINGRQTI